MVKSRRTKTSKKAPKRNRKDQKADTIAALQSALKTHPHVYLFRLDNPRNVFFQRLRRDLSETTTFWLGRNRLLQRALGKDAQSAAILNADQVSALIKHNTGLVCSRLTRGELEDALSGYAMCDYGRAGSVAAVRVAVSGAEDCGGVLCRADTREPISASAEPMLRSAGVPTMLRGGSVLLAQGKEFVVCEAGDRLTANQARILKCFGVQTDEFSVKLVAHFDCSSSVVTEF